MKLLIVESPGKLKTLRQILGSGWSIEASVGHTTELSYEGPRRLGFEFTEGKIKTKYIPRGDRGKQVLAKLKQAVAKAEMVYLATDPDREGEAIAWHLVEQLKIKNFKRVAYTQITDAAVKKAIANPIGLNKSLIESQRARQCLDKLVGFEVSPLLWNTTGGKSAGRVQTAALHILCERERERLNFKPEKYWVLKSFYSDAAAGPAGPALTASNSKEGFEAVYEVPNAPTAATSGGSAAEASGDASEVNRVRTEEEAARIAEVARTSPHLVTACELKTEPRNPPPPLITSSLQQVAGAKFRFSPKHTMSVAQELYEGIQGKGLITYMRTDAVALSPEFVEETRAWLKAQAPEAWPESAPSYRQKADAQGAHEAIRPTTVDLTPDAAAKILNPDQLKLYTLIWERAVASQCKPARLSKTKITIQAKDTTWIARGTTVVEPGYLRFWKNLEETKELPKVLKDQVLGFEDVKTTAQETKPPPRYSEPRLVQAMERKGIGRPSTYASTISTLKDREYVELEKQLLAPTVLGMATDEALTKGLPDLVDTKFTADMESALDQIAEGKRSWEEWLTHWNSQYLVPAVSKAKGLMQGIARVAPESAPRKSGFVLPPEKQQKIEKATAVAKKNDMQPKCPKGHGDLALRLSKKETFYWKCAFPECDSMAWYQDLSTQKCPACGFRMEKIPSKKVTGGYFLKCARVAAHKDEVVFFKNKATKEWEQAKGPKVPLAQS